MKRSRVLYGLLFLLLNTAFAADISGKWSGTIAVRDQSSGTVITTPVEIQFSQQDSTVSGKIGRAREADAVPIRNIRIEGNKIYFEAASEETTGPCKFSLTITGDIMEGDMTGAVESEDIIGKVKITRSRA